MDTIVAPCTASGPAIRAIVRLSGPRAFEIARGNVPAGGWAQEFRGPRSFTGEDVAELHVPGIPPLVASLVERCLAAGARMAEPGEFTRRALAARKIDLAQAEGVAALVHARDEAERRGALAVLRGELSRRVEAMRERLLDLVARAEAAIDFAEEDLGVDVERDLLGPVREARSELAALLASRGGDGPREEARVVLCGRANVGKSSLWNRLVRRARAIVADAPGTTRDPLEASGSAGGRTVRWIDTAGEDASAGDLARRAIALGAEERGHADVIVWVVDASVGLVEEDLRVLPALPVERTVVAANKRDLGWRLDGAGLPGRVVPTSALQGAGIGRLKKEVGRLLEGEDSSGASPLLVTARVRDAIRRAEEALARVPSAARVGLELAAADLRDSLDALGEVVGRAGTEEILGRVFEAFCIGK